MKVVHVPFGYFPDVTGGTEVYVAGLTAHLAKLGIQNVVCAPGPRREAYLHNCIPVRRFPVHQGRIDLRALYGGGDELAAEEFGRILENECPDLVHLHAFTSAVSLKVVRQARKRGASVVLTCHTPSVSCLQGTLIRGNDICDGVLDSIRCSACAAEHWGLDRFSAGIVARLPVGVGHSLGNLGLQGGVWTALRCSELVQLWHQAVNSVLAEVDHVVAVCDWVRQLLLRNEVPAEKVTLSRHGVAFSAERAPAGCEIELKRDAKAHRCGGLKVVCLGRFEPKKGFHLLVEAFRRAPDIQATLDIFGMGQGATETAYAAELKAMAKGDARIAFRAPIAPPQVVKVLGTYDLVAVPSEWLETGPLVVLEAFAAGTPVIGWARGGLAELVRSGIDGILLKPPCIQEWVSAFRQCAADDRLITRLKAGIRPPRTMEFVAQEMASLYERLQRG